MTRAAGAGLSVSGYLRAAGMNHPLRMPKTWLRSRSLPRLAQTLAVLEVC